MILDDRRSTSWAWKHVRPPAGLQVRRLVVLLCLVIGLPRILQPDGVMFLLPRLPIGWAFTLLAVALAVTCWRWRRQWPGRVVASVGFAMFVTLGIDAWGASTTSALISLVIALALLGETAGSDDC